MIRGAAVCLATIGRDSQTMRVVSELDESWYDSDKPTGGGRRAHALIKAGAGGVNRTRVSESSTTGACTGEKHSSCSVSISKSAV